MKYIKLYEDFSEKIGDTITVVANHVKHGFSYGSGFIVQKRDDKGKWIENINCKEGTEITGTIVRLPIPPLNTYTLKLDDGYFVGIDLGLFKKKEAL